MTTQMNSQLAEEIKTGIETIDQQHKVIIEVVDELREATIQGGLLLHLNSIFDKLKGYTQYHFGTEEAFFAEFNYEGAEEHIAAHRKMTIKLDAFFEDFQSEGPKVAAELSIFLTKWLIEHVRDMDRKYVDCFKRHGLR
jgi:hemerythrin-like metal-binding protein